MKYEKIVASLAGLFPKLLTVRYIDIETETVLKLEKKKAAEFENIEWKPTVIEIDGIPWRVIAIDNYAHSKAVDIRVVSPQKQIEYLKGSLIPTYATPPDFVELTSNRTANQLFLNITEWRQLEFLSIEAMEDVCTELEKISKITSSGNQECLLGYSNPHLRTIDLTVMLPKEAIIRRLCTRYFSDVIIEGYGKAKNCIGIKSEIYTYYANESPTHISGLYLKSFEYLDEELINLLEEYKLILVDWCNAVIIN